MHKTKWKVKNAHPLVLLYDENSPRDFYIEHLMESVNKRVHFKLNTSRNVIFTDYMLYNETPFFSSFEMMLWKKIPGDEGKSL